MGLFWTPFDVRFAKILERFEQHNQLYEAGLHDVYTKETLLHFNTVDLDMQKNAERRFEMEADITRRESQVLCKYNLDGHGICLSLSD